MDSIGVVLVGVSVLQGLGAAQLGAISVAVGVIISARREDVRSMSVLVDGGAGLVIAVALGALHGAVPVLVAPDNGVVRRDSVGESARVTVVVDIGAVDLQDSSGGVGALLGNGLEAVGDALTVSGGRGLEVLLELGSRAIEGGISSGVGLGGAAPLTFGNGGLLAGRAVALDGGTALKSNMDGLGDLGGTLAVDVERYGVAVVEDGLVTDQLSRSELGNTELTGSANIVDTRLVEAVDLGEINNDLLALTGLESSECALVKGLAKAELDTVELSLLGVLGNLKVVGRDLVKDGTLVQDVVALAAVVGDDSLDSSVANGSDGDADGNSSLLGVDGSGGGEASQGKRSERVLHDGYILKDILKDANLDGFFKIILMRSLMRVLYNFGLPARCSTELCQDN